MKKNNLLVLIIFIIVLLISLIIGIFFYKKDDKDNEIFTTTTTNVVSNNKTFKNANYNISLIVNDANDIDKTARLDINEIEAAIKYENIIKIYDINLVDSNENVISVSNKNMVMSIPYDNIDNYNSFNILYLDDNNEIMETIPTKYENNFIMFELNNLSKYAIQGVREESELITTKLNDSKTTTKKTTKKTTTTTKTTEKITENQTVTIESGDNYLVRFDKNGGSCYYQNTYVRELNSIKYPGPCSKSGYTFVGWYLNGKEYDFNTPIRSDITLIAEYIKNPSSGSGSGSTGGTKSNIVSTLVYSMGMDYNNVKSLTINHTLSIKNAITEIEKAGIDSTDVTQLRIRSISYVGPIDTSNEAYDYVARYKDTFLNSTLDNKTYELAHMGIVKTPTFDYNTDYKKTLYAVTNGFDVTWRVDGIKRGCTTPFNSLEKQNVCNFGIIYKVIWEYNYNN